jgi:hypothetical protein
MRRTGKRVSWRAAWEWLRQHAVLTTQEKKLVAFAAAMLLLGVGTKEYRDRNARPAAAELAEEALPPLDAPAPRAKSTRLPAPPPAPGGN